VLNIVQKCNTQFYLTGGTALGRAYYHHRYSDDLDFFTTRDINYKTQVEVVLASLKENGYSWSETENFTRNDNFLTIKVFHKDFDAQLKLDFVNDTVPNFGEIVNTPLYYRVDSIHNIISNKIGALYRFEGKDIADLRELSLREHFSWPAVLNEARQKDGGVESSIISDILTTVPEYAFNDVKWRDPVPTFAQFQADLKVIVHDMINCIDNTLVKGN
jgi:predicted nucleotidyltransferase component of viral defense system